MINYAEAMKTVRTIWLIAVVLVVSSVALWGWAKEYRLHLTIETDKQEEFVLVIELDTRQFRRLENDPRNEIQDYLVEARRQYARRIGYREEIYGKENYKMVRIERYHFVVREIDRGRVVLKK